jgi:hypothetical protein
MIMFQFTISKSLFGDTGIHYFDPITEKPLCQNCQVKDVQATQESIQRRILIELCSWFVRNGQNTLSWLQNNKPEPAYRAYSKNFAVLCENANKLPGIFDLETLADFTHLHIYPTIAMMEPKTENSKTIRYRRLLFHLDSLLTSISQDGICNVKPIKNGEKAVNY